jgi:acyl-CoA reductase-like NAD-dependent aldehyde dehydrogenase
VRLERHRMLRKGDYIWGSFIKPERVDGYVVGVNPGDRADVLGRFVFSESSVDDAVQAAARGLTVWRQGTTAQRAAALRRYREALGRSQDRFAAMITRETGKPLWESRQEVVSAIRAVDLLLEDGIQLLDSRVLSEQQARSDWRPRGVVGIIAAYTAPLLTPTLQVASALLAGNTVVFKPSKFTPGVGQGVAELIDRCRLPRGAFNLVQGSGSSIGQRLAGHPGIDALLFTGTWTTAVTVTKATKERPELPALLQCGGKGAAIVLDDADVERTVYEVLVGAYLTAGQRPNSTARVFVTKGIYEKFLDELTRRARNVRAGYGFDRDVLFGPVISENFRTRYRRYGRTLLARGHTPILEAANLELPRRHGFYVKPAIYEVNWENGTTFLNDPPPGPIVLVYKVSSWEEAASLHNQLVYRGTTSLFTDPDHPRVVEIGRRLKCGALYVNRGTIASSLRLPAVGLGRASNGLAGGLELLRFLSAPRATVVETRPFDASQMVPGVRWDPTEAEEEDDEDQATDIGGVYRGSAP